MEVLIADDVLFEVEAVGALVEVEVVDMLVVVLLDVVVDV